MPRGICSVYAPRSVILWLDSLCISTFILLQLILLYDTLQVVRFPAPVDKVLIPARGSVSCAQCTGDERFQRRQKTKRDVISVSRK